MGSVLLPPPERAHTSDANDDCCHDEHIDYDGNGSDENDLFFILKPPPGLLQWCLHNNKDVIKPPRSATSLTLPIVDFVVLMNTFLQSTIALAVTTRIKL